MSTTVYKFELPVEDIFTIEMPVGSEILHVEAQDGRPYLWALVDSGSPMGQRVFQTRGTGQDATGVRSYVGTYQLVSSASPNDLIAGATFVGHVFEVVAA